MKINKGVITLARAGSLLPMLFEILVEVQAFATTFSALGTVR
jgi:hypothetical protein